MIFYKYTCSNQTKNVSASKEMTDKLVKQDINLYNTFCEEEQDDEIFLFMVQDEVDKLVFDVIFKKSLNKVNMLDGFAHKFIKSMGKSFEMINRNEISINSLYNDLEQANAEEFVDNINSIKSRFDIDFAFHRCFNEYMISKKNFSKDEVLELCDKYVLNDEIKEEIERIYAPRQDNTFGVPVHYILNMGGKTGQDAVEVLIDALHSSGRMLRDKYTVLHPSRLRCCDMDLFFEILSVFKVNDGGVVVISSNMEIDKTDRYSREMEVLEKICQVCKLASKDTTIIFQLSSVRVGQENYIKNNLSNLSFIEIKDIAIQNEMAKNFLLRMASKYNIVETQSLLNLVEPNKNYEIFELEDMFKNWHKNYIQTVQFPQYSMFMKLENHSQEKNTQNDGYTELNGLIGLENVKKIVNDFINYQKLQQACEHEKMKIMQFSRHMCFIGNPGTAKTTVARLIAQIMKEENLLSTGRLIEVGRADIVSKFVGGTAPKVKEFFKQAIGNVLFIDEAYSLCDGKDGLYGDEAINTIVQEMENNREDTVVIFAGYKKEMQKFLDKNSGLRSRIAFEVEFPNYSEDELTEIAKLYAKKMDVDISQCLDKIREIVKNNMDDRNFGNGRFIRSLLEKARMKQATRLVNNNLLYTPKMRELLPEDIEMPVVNSNKFSMGFHS